MGGMRCAGIGGCREDWLFELLPGPRVIGRARCAQDPQVRVVYEHAGRCEGWDKGGLDDLIQLNFEDYE